MKLKFSLFYIITLIYLIVMLPSCDNNLEVEIPAYIYIDTIELNTNIFTEGAPTQKITELWVYADNNPVGVFSTNQLIPILSTDFSNPKISIFAGIRANGSKSDIQIYFLYSELKIDKELYPGKIDTLTAKFSYSKNANFIFIEDFENGNIFNKDVDKDSKTNITQSTENPINGKYSGKISLTSENNQIEVTTFQDYYNLPKGGNAIFLEADYKCNTGLIIGLSGKLKNGSEYKVDLIYLKEKENWNKLYLDITSQILNSGLESYKIYFRAVHNSENSTSTIFIDNIKLLYSNI